MNNLDSFLSGAGDRLYRAYIEHLVRKMPLQQVISAGAGELEIVESCCVAQRQELLSLIEPAKKAFIFYLYTNGLRVWNKFTCRDAAEFVEREIGSRNIIKSSVTDAEEIKNAMYSFFLVFSYLVAVDAHNSREFRKSMGIRKGLFG